MGIRDVGKSDSNESKTQDPCSSRSRHSIIFPQGFGVPSTVLIDDVIMPLKYFQDILQ